MQEPPLLPPPGKPPGLIARAAATVLALLVAATAFFLGLFVFALLAGLVVLIAGVVWARFWWATRALRRQMRNRAGQPPSDRPAADNVIEGEFRERD